MEPELSPLDNKNALYKPEHKDATQFKDWNDWQKLPSERFFEWDQKPHCSADVAYTKKWQNGYGKLTTSYFPDVHDRSENGPIGFKARFSHKLFNGTVKLDADGRKLKGIWDFGTLQPGGWKINPFIQGSFKINWQPFPIGQSDNGVNQNKMFPGMDLLNWRSRWQVGAVSTRNLGNFKWYNVTMGGMCNFKPTICPVKTTLELDNPGTLNLQYVLQESKRVMNQIGDEHAEKLTEEEANKFDDLNLADVRDLAIKAIHDYFIDNNENKYSFTCNNSFVKGDCCHNLNVHLVYDTKNVSGHWRKFKYSYLKKTENGNTLFRYSSENGFSEISTGRITQSGDTILGYNSVSDITYQVPWTGMNFGADVKVNDNVRVRTTWSTDNTFKGRIRANYNKGSVPISLNITGRWHPSFGIYDVLRDGIGAYFNMQKGNLDMNALRHMNSISRSLRWGINLDCGDI